MLFPTHQNTLMLRISCANKSTTSLNLKRECQPLWDNGKPPWTGWLTALVITSGYSVLHLAGMNRPFRSPSTFSRISCQNPFRVSFELPQLDDWNSVKVALVLVFIIWAIVALCFTRLSAVINRGPTKSRPQTATGHLMVVLGSGGHTAEMLNILSSLPRLREKYSRRTYVVSSGDGFSALKAAEFERNMADVVGSGVENCYAIVTVRRARRVHQGVLTAPWTTMRCLWDCVKLLRGTEPDHRSRCDYPDLVLTNGPGTGVCVVAACLLLLFLGLGGPPVPLDDEADSFAGAGQMRTIFIESWARVRTLSLSGRILKLLVNRFLVQWPQIADPADGGAEYIGPLVS